MDRYRLPGGGVGRYYFVDMPGSAATVPLWPDGSTVLLEVDRYLLGQRLWEWPIGGMLPGEDPAVVAAKELAEEAGLRAKRWTPMGRFAPYKGVSTEVCHTFLAEDLIGGEQELEDSERIAVHRMTLAEARARLLEAELGDGQSLVVLLHLERHLRATGRDGWLAGD